MKGRKPKPSHLKLVQGNTRKQADREKNARKGTRATSVLPSMPQHMSAGAKTVWGETVARLGEMVSVDQLDMFLLEDYCENVAQLRSLRGMIAAEGSTYETHTKNGVMIRTRPEQAQIFQLQRMIKSQQDALGLTPASRPRIPSPGQGDLFGDRGGWGGGEF